MQITIDTNNAKDLELLQKLVGSTNGVSKPATHTSLDDPQRAAIVKEHTEWLDAVTKEEAAPKKTAAAPVPETPAEPTPAGPTMDDAVALVTKVVSGGKAAVAKYAISQLGAERVSKLDPEKIPALIEALTTNFKATEAAAEAAQLS